MQLFESIFLIFELWLLLSRRSRSNREGAEVEEMEEQVEMVGRAFVDHYYLLFDSDRASLSALYQPTSMLSFEGQKIFGVDDISAKLNQLPFDQCKHLISTVDSQPSSTTGGIVVFVSGSLQLSGEEHLLRFSQVIINNLHNSLHLLIEIWLYNICLH